MKTLSEEFDDFIRHTLPASRKFIDQDRLKIIEQEKVTFYSGATAMFNLLTSGFYSKDGFMDKELFVHVLSQYRDELRGFVERLPD